MPLFKVHCVTFAVWQVVCFQFIIHDFVDMLEILVRQKWAVVFGDATKRNGRRFFSDR